MDTRLTRIGRIEYDLTIVSNHCMPGAMSVNAIARLDRDVGPALPFLNAVLGGLEYISEPPAVTFQAHGRLISVRPDQITVNGVRDRDQARKIMDWICREITGAWEDRENIIPCYTGREKPSLPEILKYLPGTNCRECGAATCMVFALQLAEGAKFPESCPRLESPAYEGLVSYLSGFDLEG